MSLCESLGCKKCVRRGDVAKKEEMVGVFTKGKYEFLGLTDAEMKGNKEILGFLAHGISG